MSVGAEYYSTLIPAAIEILAMKMAAMTGRLRFRLLCGQQEVPSFEAAFKFAAVPGEPSYAFFYHETSAKISWRRATRPESLHKSVVL